MTGKGEDFCYAHFVRSRVKSGGNNDLISLRFHRDNYTIKFKFGFLA